MSLQSVPQGRSLHPLPKGDVYTPRQKKEGSVVKDAFSPKSAEGDSPAPPAGKKRIKVADLMQGAREVILLHEGEEYILRITKAKRLILTK